MMKEAGVKSVTTWVGSGVPRFYLPLDQVFPQTNVSEAIVEPVDLKVRESLRKKLPALMATEFPELRTRVKLLPNGPPVPYPVQFRVMGPDADQVRKWGDEAKAVLRANPHMRGVNDNWNENVLAMRLDDRPGQGARARRDDAGDRAGDADAVLRLDHRPVPRGRPADRHRAAPAAGRAQRGDRPVERLRGHQQRRASCRWRRSPSCRWAGSRACCGASSRSYAVTVQGDVVEGLQGPTVTDELWGKGSAVGPLQALMKKMPPGYEIQVAGAVEEASKGQGAIAAGVPVMLFIIFTLLMLQLHSFSRAVLVFLTGPLGVAGAAGGAAGAQPAVRLRRAAGRDRADGHDHAQLGDPDRPDRAGPRATACRPGTRSSSRWCGASARSC